MFKVNRETWYECSRCGVATHDASPDGHDYRDVILCEHCHEFSPDSEAFPDDEVRATGGFDEQYTVPRWIHEKYGDISSDNDACPSYRVSEDESLILWVNCFAWGSREHGSRFVICQNNGGEECVILDTDDEDELKAMLAEFGVL